MSYLTWRSLRTMRSESRGSLLVWIIQPSESNISARMNEWGYVHNVYSYIISRIIRSWVWMRLSGMWGISSRQWKIRYRPVWIERKSYVRRWGRRVRYLRLKSRSLWRTRKRRLTFSENTLMISLQLLRRHLRIKQLGTKMRSMPE